MSLTKFHPNLDDIAYEFYYENDIDSFIQMVLSYKARKYSYIKIQDDGAIAFYRPETDEQRTTRLAAELVAEEERKQREKELELKRLKANRIRDTSRLMLKLETLINNSKFLKYASPEYVVETLQKYNNAKKEFDELKNS